MFTMPTTTTSDIIIVTSKYLPTSLKQTNKNSLLPSYDTITRKEKFQLDSIFYNFSPLLNSLKSPIFKLPKVPTPKPVAASPRVSPSTTEDFQSISPTTQKQHRYLCSTKSRTYWKPPPIPFPSSTFKSNPCCIPCLLDNRNAASATLNIPTKL